MVRRKNEEKVEVKRGRGRPSRNVTLVRKNLHLTSHHRDLLEAQASSRSLPVGRWVEFMIDEEEARLRNRK